MKLTKRESLGGGRAPRAIIIESRFAAYARCSTDPDGKSDVSDAERAKPEGRAGRLISRILTTLPYMSLLGLVGAVANVAVSFEEPHMGMLFVSALLLGAAPLGMAAHLACTAELTREDRRLWITGLMSRKGATLFAAYFNAGERRTATQRLSGNGAQPSLNR